MARVTLAQSAQADLLEAWLYLAEENQQAADRMLDTVDKDNWGQIRPGLHALPHRRR